MKKIIIILLIVFALAGLSFSQATAGCTIVWWGERSGSIPTNETSRTQQATIEVAQAIYGQCSWGSGWWAEGNSASCDGCIDNNSICYMLTSYPSGSWYSEQSDTQHPRPHNIYGNWDVVCDTNTTTSQLPVTTTTALSTTTTSVSTTTSSIPATTTTVLTTDWVPMNSGTTAILTTVWGTSPNNVFAAGGTIDADGVVLFYNGTAWSLIDSPVDVVFSMWGTSNSNIHAAGLDGLCHYDGSSWTCDGYAMIGIWGSSAENIFAVGVGGEIDHYDGTSWSSMQSGTIEMLNSVWCSSSNDAFAVGTAGIILHYDGSSWVSMSSGTTNRLNGVWGNSGSDVFAAGDAGTILHYNGSAWSVIASGTVNGLYSVWGDSGSDVFIVGGKGTILHYNGLSCSTMQSGTTKNLNDVWGFAGKDVFAVGDNGTILRYSRTATVIDLSSFTVSAANKAVIINWSTESETDNAGFNLYRSESKNGEYIKINNGLIPTQGSSTQGASYKFIDNNLQNRKTYYYKLEDIDLNGTSTMHEPVSATPRLIYWIGK